MKLSTHMMRERSGISHEVIKRIVALEDQLAEGELSKQGIFEIADIYSRFVDYLEFIRDPLKLYFQEKIESLFLKKAVMKAIIREDNTTNGPERKVEILSDDFLNFSEIQDINGSILQSSIRTIDQKLILPQERRESRNKKNIGLELMFKVNSEMNKQSNDEDAKISKKFTDFKDNDVTVKESLDQQESLISNKLKDRRSRVITKERMKNSRYISQTMNSFADSFEKTPANGTRTTPNFDQMSTLESKVVDPKTLLTSINEFSFVKKPGVKIGRESATDNKLKMLETLAEEKVPDKYNSQSRSSMVSNSDSSLKFTKKKQELVIEDYEEDF